MKKPKNPTQELNFFEKFSVAVTKATGSTTAIVIAFAVVIIWALSGPYFHYSENWQLVINTGTTIVTFLMVFLIQGAQNRESRAIHLKLDELIMGVNHARNELIDIETLTDKQLEALSRRYRKEAQRHQH